MSNINSLTIDDLEALACGEMGLTISEFYDLTELQWFNISKGYYNKIERETRLHWETTRMIMYATLLPHQKKGSNLTVKSVLPFAWDNETVVENATITTAEDIEAVKQRWKERDKKRKKRQPKKE